MPTTMTIPKRLTHGEELVVLTKKEYEDAIQKNKEILEVLKIIFPLNPTIFFTRYANFLMEMSLPKPTFIRLILKSLFIKKTEALHKSSM